jgi:hypothetical protein
MGELVVGWHDIRDEKGKATGLAPVSIVINFTTRLKFGETDDIIFVNKVTIRRSGANVGGHSIN